MSGSIAVVAEGQQFALFSTNDGGVYILNNKEEKNSAHLEGDDAATMLKEYETLKIQFSTYTVDQLLAQLWDQGGYSWMAVPDEKNGE